MNRLLLLVGAATLLLAGCRKDDLVDCTPAPAPAPPPNPVITPPNPATSNLSLAEFAQRNGAPVQYFRFAPNVTQTVTTRGRARITLPARYFYLPTGALATDTCTLRVREIYSVPEMVLADMPTGTTPPQTLLISAGEFSIQAWQGSVRLRADSSLTNAMLGLASPRVAGQDTTGQLLWQLVTDVFLVAPRVPGWRTQSSYSPVQTTTAFNRASIPLDSLSWWNIDKLWSAYTGASSVAISIETPAVTSSNGTRVYVRPTGLNGLVRMNATGSAGTQWQANMPQGASMQAIVLQSISGQLYFGTQQFTVQSGVAIKPTLAAVSEADAVRLIRQL